MRLRSTAILLGACWLVGMAFAAPEGKTDGELLLQPENPEVAAPFEMLLRVRVPDGTVVQLPGASAPVAPFEMLAYESSQRTEGAELVFEAKYRLFGSMSGKQELGPFSVDLKLADGKERQLLVGPVSFELRSLIATLEHPLEDILPIKGLLPPPQPTPPSRLAGWLGLGAIVLLAALGSYLFWRRRKRAGSPPELAHLLALRRLQELGRRELGSPDSVEPFYVELSGILRRYLESRFSLPVMELTTFEIKRAFDPGVHGPNWTFRLYQLLERMDLVKFARFRMSASAAFEDLQTARSLVEELVERDAKAEDERKRESRLQGASSTKASGG